MKRIITSKKIKDFEIYLRNEERSKATIEKYMRDVRYFTSFVGDAEIDKKRVVDYKSKLSDGYAVASANSMIAALNCFFAFASGMIFVLSNLKYKEKFTVLRKKSLPVRSIFDCLKRPIPSIMNGST